MVDDLPAHDPGPLRKYLGPMGLLYHGHGMLDYQMTLMEPRFSPHYATAWLIGLNICYCCLIGD